MKLNSKMVTQLRLPSGKTDVIYFDDDIAGFGVRLRASGSRVRQTWIAQYRAHGRTRRMKIGEKITAEEARKAAQKILARVELGEDPQGDKAAARSKAARTLRSVAEEYLRAKQPILRPASYYVTKLYLTGPYFKPLHTTTITDISLADVAARLTAITRNNGSVTSSRARAALSSLFRWTIGEGLLGAHPINPVTGTNRPEDATPRERVLTDAELVAIWCACNDDNYGRVVKLLTLTGCRREEIGGMKWSELDISKGTLSLPKERVKNKRQHVVPLSELALTIIAQVPQRLHRDHLFGGRGRRGFTNWAVGKRELDRSLAGRVAPWRVHDLRRTVATRMADLGVLPHIVETALNHVSGHKGGIAGVYNRSLYEGEVRAALILWADHVRAIVDGAERNPPARPPQIVTFPQRASRERA